MQRRQSISFILIVLLSLLAPLTSANPGFAQGPVLEPPADHDPVDLPIEISRVDPGAASALTSLQRGGSQVVPGPLYVDVINSVPFFLDLPDQALYGAAPDPAVIDLWAHVWDAQVPVELLLYTLESTPPPGVDVTIGENRWLNLAPEPGWSGWTDVTVRATDPGGEWAEDTLRLTVNLSSTLVAAGDAPPVELAEVQAALDCAAGPGGTVTVTHFYTGHPNAPLVSASPRYWDLTSNFTDPFACDLAFTYDETDLGGATEGDLAGAAHWDESNVHWEYVGGAVDTGANTVTIGDVSAFSPWLLLTSTPPRAVADLGGIRAGSDLELVWTAVTEDLRGGGLTPDHYVVYRRADEPYFTPTPSDIIATPTTSGWTDPGVLGDPAHNYYYVVTAVDGAGVESAPSVRLGAFDQALVPAGQAGQRAYNLIAVNLDVPGVGDADALAAYAGAGVYMVLRHDAATQSIEWRLPGLAGTNFDVTVGDAVYLYLDDSASQVVSLVGTVPPQGNVGFGLTPAEPGGSCAYNFISVPLGRDDLVDAATLAADIGGVYSVTRYNAPTQDLTWWTSGGGDNFSVRPGYPYSVCLEETAPLWWP